MVDLTMVDPTPCALRKCVVHVRTYSVSRIDGIQPKHQWLIWFEFLKAFFDLFQHVQQIAL